MSVLTGGPFEWLLPLVILIVGLVLGPLPLVVRGLIRVAAGPRFVHRWYRPATLGLGVGLVGSVIVVATMDGGLALNTALLCLLLVLAIIDWQWRWLPVEWTASVIILGVIYAIQSGDLLQVLIQMAVPTVALLVARKAVLWTTGKEALGLGDVWLVAGLGAFLAPFESFLLIGFAALSGLVEIGIRRLLGRIPLESTGVSYGTHLCTIFVVIRNFTTLG